MLTHSVFLFFDINYESFKSKSIANSFMAECINGSVDWTFLTRTGSSNPKTEHEFLNSSPYVLAGYSIPTYERFGHVLRCPDH